MKESFGALPNGEQANLYTISCGNLTAQVTDYGATLVRMFVPGDDGKPLDVVLGYDNAADYAKSTAYFGCTIGRNANRVAKARFMLSGKEVKLIANEFENSLHSSPNSYAFRLWQTEQHTNDSVTFYIYSPDGDQGFPGNAEVRVTYRLEYPSTLRVIYEGVCDQDTVFNMTNHTYFNMAGHDKPELAMNQTLMLPGQYITPCDAESIPTGELRSVEGTPMDFRTAKVIGRDIAEDYECLRLQGGYDCNYELINAPGAVLTDPVSGRSVTVSSDCPGIQFYSGNFLSGEVGKEGVSYCHRGGVALEPHYFPDSVNHPEWAQPFFKAGQCYHSETTYTFQ